MGRLLIIFILCVAGIGLLIQYNVSFAWFGNLPGDIIINYGKMKVYLPFTTSILVSFALAVFLWIFSAGK